ncbi:MAG: glycosyltransferase family 2 protein [Candidatus Methylumidiphilus sp.]
MPAISVIIPSYNCELYITETISSVLNQTYKDFELIVVDDGSTDKTQEIVASFGSPVRLVMQQNSGVCKARNRGIDEAKGRFICLLDHDDHWFPDKLGRQIKAFDENPDVGVVYSSFICWHQNSLDDTYPDPASYDLATYGDGINTDLSGWIYHQFLLDCWMLTSTAMFRAEVFEKCGAFDESLPYSEDWDLWLRLSQEYSFVNLRRPSTLYRQHPRQGNRSLREVDYRTNLLVKSAQKWGLCSHDGRCLTQTQFNQTVACYHAEYALGHLIADNRKIALRSFMKAWICYPLRLKYLAYIVLSQTGWKPSWSNTHINQAPHK